MRRIFDLSGLESFLKPKAKDDRPPWKVSDRPLNPVIYRNFKSMLQGYTTFDEVSIAQAELSAYIEAQAQAIAPEPEVEFIDLDNFYNYKALAAGKTIATITHDCDDFVTQPWVVMVGDVEVHRADTWAKCAHYIQWHYKQGTLPVAKTTTKLELAPDAIKVGDKRFYKVCLDDFTRCIACNDDELDWTWCAGIVTKVYKKTVDIEYKIPDSEETYIAKKVKISRLRRNVLDSYWESAYDGFDSKTRLNSLSEGETQATDEQSASLEELLNKPFDQLTSVEWELLKQYEPQSDCFLAA